MKRWWRYILLIVLATLSAAPAPAGGAGRYQDSLRHEPAMIRPQGRKPDNQLRTATPIPDSHIGRPNRLTLRQ